MQCAKLHERERNDTNARRFDAGSKRIQDISARNQIAGTVASVKQGDANGHVAIETAEGARIMGSVTNETIANETKTGKCFIFAPPRTIARFWSCYGRGDEKHARTYPDRTR